MIGLGMACSHAGPLFRPPETWQQLMNETMAPGVFERYPEAARQRDSLEECQALHKRAHDCFAQMRKEAVAYKPDVIVLVGDDQGDLFNSSNNPTLSIYTGEEQMWGHTGYEWDVPMKDRTLVHYNNHAELARYLTRGLMNEGFDPSVLHTFKPAGREGFGLPHMASRIAPELDPTGEIPVVCVFLNEYFPPLPDGKRCADLGRALAKLLNKRDERILLVASGGLSHYQAASDFNRGDIDSALDRWVLERIERGDAEALEHLFTFDSHNLRSGTGEIRAWISLAAAMNRPGRVLDYMPIHACYAGISFVTWSEQG